MIDFAKVMQLPHRCRSAFDRSTVRNTLRSPAPDWHHERQWERVFGIATEDRLDPCWSLDHSATRKGRASQKDR